MTADINTTRALLIQSAIETRRHLDEIAAFTDDEVENVLDTIVGADGLDMWDVLCGIQCQIRTLTGPPR
jgi:hypothetical protein